MKPVMTIDEDGNKIWRLNGKLHREDGPAIQFISGRRDWYINDKLHREDGPAIEDYDGTKYWFINYKRHREDGPAIEWSYGRKDWYINDEYINLEEIINKYPNGYGPWTSSDLAKLKLKYL